MDYQSSVNLLFYIFSKKQLIFTMNIWPIL